MHARGRFLAVILAAAAVACVGCQGGATLRPKPPTKGAPKVTTEIAGGTSEVPAATETPRVIDQVGVAAELTGKVKLLSDHGGGIISNNTGSLISDHGGAIISDHGAGLVSNNGGGLTGKTKWGLLAADAAPAEAALAEARIEVLDAAGHILVDKSRSPLTATSDAAGSYHFKAVLPNENLVFRVRLFPHGGPAAGPAAGGQLLSIVPRDGRTASTDLPIDTAAALGASYVLDHYVKGRQDVFDRLPATEASALHRDADAARVGLAGPPSYKAADLDTATDNLRTKAPALDQTLERIRSILLAGLADLGNGQDATRVALALPSTVVGDKAGNLYVSEEAAARVRRIDPAGKIVTFAGTGARSNGSNQLQTLEFVGGMAFAPDGNLYVTQILSGQIRRIHPDGSVDTAFGALTSGDAGTIRRPTSIAVAPDGTVYVGETRNGSTDVGRLWSLSPDGKATQLTLPPDVGAHPSFASLALGADGTLFVESEANDTLYARAGDGTWKTLATALDLGKHAGIAAGPAGEVYVARDKQHQVVRITPDGQSTVVAGNGEAGYDGDGGPATAARLNQPAGLWCAADGTLYMADLDGVVRKIAHGTITTVAGTKDVIVGDALTIPINGPGGVAIDSQNRVVFSEAGSSTIKRLDGNHLTVVAGTTAGLSGDGGPAAAAQLASPAGIAYAGDALYVIDGANNRIRKIDGAGTITTVARRADVVPDAPGPGPFPPDQAPIVYPLAIACAPDGTPYWTDTKSEQILHLTAAGQVEVIAGTFGKTGADGDDGPAAKALLSSPTSLAFDKAGDLYFCDSQNLVVRKIALSGPQRTITRVAGLSQAQTIASFAAAIASGGVVRDDAKEEGARATDVALLGPVGLCFDAAGNLYVSELGTAKLASFGGVGGLPDDLVKQLPAVGTRIRRISPDGTIHLVAGDGTRVLNDPTGDESMLYPFLMTFDHDGRLIVVDSALDQIKMLKPGTLAP